jgi:predicted HTH domain antitoxin
MKLEVELDLPPEVLKLISAADMRDVYRTEIILRLFEDDKIGSAQATHLLGLSRLRFMELLRQRGIAHATYTASDLEDALKDLSTLRPEIDKNVAESRARGLK